MCEVLERVMFIEKDADMSVKSGHHDSLVSAPKRGIACLPGLLNFSFRLRVTCRTLQGICAVPETALPIDSVFRQNLSKC